MAEKIRKKSGGETIPVDAKSMYDKSVEKSEKVLAYYDKSKYVDDAIFLIAMCYVRIGEFTKALRKFNELLSNFPETEYAEDARYWRNVCLYYGGKEDIAIDSLKALALENPERAEEAMYMIGELAYKNERYIEAKSAFLDFLEHFPKSSFVPMIHMRLGQIEWHFEEYETAAHHFEQVGESDVPVEDYFTSRKLLIKCYIKIGRLDDADKIIAELLKDETYMPHWSELELLSGDVYYARGEIQKAMDIWNSLIDRYPNTSVAAWAYYKLGEVYFARGDLDKALDMYNSAAKTGTDPEVRELARKRSEQITRLLAYKKQIENPDSAGISVVSAKLALAEMYLTEFGQPDSAIKTYESVLEKYPDDSLAPKASYSLGWVWAFAKKNYKKADSVYAQLLKEYPESDYAVGGAKYFKSRGGSLDSLAVRNVAYYFIKGEEFWLTYNWKDSALAYYDIVIDSFPNSVWVPKSMSAKAEILIELGRNDEAKQIYMSISSHFAGTEYDSLAKLRLGESVAIVQNKVVPPKVDTTLFAKSDTGYSAKNDTFRGTYDNLPQAPRPLKRIRLSYPEQEWSSRLQGRTVRIKIKIDAFGKVNNAKLLMSCGNTVIDHAAMLAVRKAEFDPSKIDISMFDKWFLIKIPVTRPVRETEWDTQ
ncbi:TonB family protein [bacterium]|nr:TonB family protein [bacterium]